MINGSRILDISVLPRYFRKYLPESDAIDQVVNSMFMTERRTYHPLSSLSVLREALEATDLSTVNLGSDDDEELSQQRLEFSLNRARLVATVASSSPHDGEFVWARHAGIDAWKEYKTLCRMRKKWGEKLRSEIGRAHV